MPGNLSLSAAQTYTGATSVSAGRLSVNDALASTAVTVSGGTLGGSGSIAGTVARAERRDARPGQQHRVALRRSHELRQRATFAYEVDSQLLGNLAAAADLQVVNGNLVIASGALLSFTDSEPQPRGLSSKTPRSSPSSTTRAPGTVALFTYAGTPLADGSRFSVGSQLWEIDYNSTTAGLNFTSDYRRQQLRDGHRRPRASYLRDARHRRWHRSDRRPPPPGCLSGEQGIDR